MKTSNVQTTHPMAIIRGWIDQGVAVRDGAGTEGIGVLDITFVGATVTDNGDGTVIVTIGGTGGAPGGTPPWDYVVAASDSGTDQQSAADAVCDGTADEVEINAAIAAAVAADRPYSILLTPGTYVIGAAVDFTPMITMNGKWVVFEASGTTILAGANMTTMIKLDPAAGGQIITCLDLRLGKLSGNATGGKSVTQIVNLARFNDNIIRVEQIVDGTGIGFKAAQSGVTDYPSGNNKIDIEIIHTLGGVAFNATGSTTGAEGFQGNTVHIGEIIGTSDGIVIGSVVNQNATYNTFICGVIEHLSGYGIRDYCGGNTFIIGNLNSNGTNLGGPTGMTLRNTYRVHIDLATSGGTAEAAVLDQHYVQINGVSYGRTLLTEKTTPSTPASGFGDIYFKSDGFLYSLNDAGTETQLGGSSFTLTIKDEGSSLTTAATSIDFVGAGVTASGTTAAKTVTIPGFAGGLDDLSDVTITSATSGDRLRYSGSAWVNSALRWEPHVAYDGTVVLDGNGDPVMVEMS